MRFAMTAKTLIRERATEQGIREITAHNVKKVTRFRAGGVEELERTVERLEEEARHKLSEAERDPDSAHMEDT